MFDNFTSTPHNTSSNSLEVAMHARAKDQKLAALIAGYRKSSGGQTKPGRRSLRQLIAAFITNLR